MTRVVFKVWGSRPGDRGTRQVLDQVKDDIESDFGSSVSVAQRPGKMIVAFGDDIDRAEVEDYIKSLYETYAEEGGGFWCSSEQNLYDEIFEEEPENADNLLEEFPGIKYPFYDVYVELTDEDGREMVFWIED